jgi:hypothetical protein
MPQAVEGIRSRLLHHRRRRARQQKAAQVMLVLVSLDQITQAPDRLLRR